MTQDDPRVHRNIHPCFLRRLDLARRAHNDGGLAIGLTLVATHLVGIQITGVSVNPARSIGPALFSGSVTAIDQFWLFIVAPMIGAAIAGLMFREGPLVEKFMVLRVEEVAT